jgi:hypothetical protein
MRHIRPVLVSLGILSFSIGPAAAENVCVHAADGAIVCGPVTTQSASPTPAPTPSASPSSGASANPSASPSTSSSKNPFDLPATTFVPQGDAAPPPAAARKPALNRPPQMAKRHVAPPKHAYRQPPPHEFDRRPPPRQIARDEMLRREAARGHRPPPHYDRERPVRYSEAERRRHEINRERPMPRFDRDVPPRQYEARLRELEREIRMLRGQREAALHRAPDRRDIARPAYGGRPPPPRYADRDMRDRYGMPQRPPRRDDRERYQD